MAYKKWSKEEIEFIVRLRDEGMSYPAIASELIVEFGEGATESAIRNTYMYYTNGDHEEDIAKLLKSRARSKITAQQERKNSNAMILDSIMNEDIEFALKRAVSKINRTKVKQPKKFKTGAKAMTVEALFSDLQIGKVSPDFNSSIALKRVQKYTSSLIFKIEQQKKLGYRVEKVILALLGDIIEGAEKARQKGADTEMSTPEQIAWASQVLFQEVLEPLASVTPSLHVVGVPGNHDHDGPGMLRDKPGNRLFSYVVYKTLQLMCEAAKLKVTFNITPGMFAVEEIYGHTVIYEHGYDCTVGEVSLANKKRQRADQLKKHVSYFRMGDKHSIHRFHEDTLVVNGAFFGCVPEDRGEEYSSAMGYSGQAAQLAFFHVPREDERLPCYDSFIIQLNHVR